MTGVAETLDERRRAFLNLFLQNQLVRDQLMVTRRLDGEGSARSSPGYAGYEPLRSSHSVGIIPRRLLSVSMSLFSRALQEPRSHILGGQRQDAAGLRLPGQINPLPAEFARGVAL